MIKSIKSLFKKNEVIIEEEKTDREKIIEKYKNLQKMYQKLEDTKNENFAKDVIEKSREEILYLLEDLARESSAHFDFQCFEEYNESHFIGTDVYIRRILVGPKYQFYKKRNHGIIELHLFKDSKEYYNEFHKYEDKNSTQYLGGINNYLSFVQKLLPSFSGKIDKAGAGKYEEEFYSNIEEFSDIFKDKKNVVKIFLHGVDFFSNTELETFFYKLSLLYLINNLEEKENRIFGQKKVVLFKCDHTTKNLFLVSFLEHFNSKKYNFVFALRKSNDFFSFSDDSWKHTRINKDFTWVEEYQRDCKSA